MKVGILTFPNSISYGAVLQMYALYRGVEKLGHDAEIINYQNAFMKSEMHVHNQNGIDKFLKFARKALHWRLYNGVSLFEKRTMQKYPLRTTEDTAYLHEIGKRYDAVICGSDQVWNPGITGNDFSYFLDFCTPATRRVSYAPSFGIDKFSEEFSQKVQKELMQFTAVSVREAPGQAFVESLLSREVPVVTDPTFLLSAAEWEKLERPHSMGQGEYILYYTIRRSQTLFQKCKDLSAKTGLPIVIVGGNPIKRFKNRDPMVRYAIDISPEEWLYLMHHARYVVTNSFHGTAFSVNFRKDFYVEFSSLTNSRLIQITEALGLTDRVVTPDREIEPSAVEYGATEEILSVICRDSLEYLKNALC